MTKRKANIIYLAFLAFFLLAGAYLVYRMNRIVGSVAIFDAITPPMLPQILNQTLFITALCAFGMALLLSTGILPHKGSLIVTAPIIGAYAWCLLSVLILCAGIPFTKWSAIAACILSLGGCIAYKLTKNKSCPPKGDWRHYGMALVMYAAAAFFFSSLCIFRFSYDSYMYINGGEMLARLGKLTPELIPMASSFSLFTQMLFAPAVFFGYDFSHGLYMMLNTAFVLAVAYFVFSDLKGEWSMKKAWLLSAAAFVYIVTSNLFFEIMYWPLSNLVTAAQIFFVLYFANKHKMSEGNLVLSLFFAVCMVLTRSENGLIMVITIFIISLADIKKARMLPYCGAVFAAILIWYLRFFLVAGTAFNEGEFLTIGRALPIVAVYAAMLIYIAFIRDTKIITNHKKALEYLFFAAFALAAIGLMLLDTEKALYNLTSTAVNMYKEGGWGAALFIAGALYLLRYVSGEPVGIWDRFTLAFLLFYLAIYMLRGTGLRIGYGDSGNRYFVHLIPVFAYLFATSFTRFMKPLKGSSADDLSAG